MNLKFFVFYICILKYFVLASIQSDDNYIVKGKSSCKEKIESKFRGKTYTNDGRKFKYTYHNSSKIISDPFLSSESFAKTQTYNINHIRSSGMYQSSSSHFSKDKSEQKTKQQLGSDTENSDNFDSSIYSTNFDSLINLSKLDSSIFSANFDSSMYLNPTEIISDDFNFLDFIEDYGLSSHNTPKLNKINDLSIEENHLKQYSLPDMAYTRDEQINGLESSEKKKVDIAKDIDLTIKLSKSKYSEVKKSGCTRISTQFRHIEKIDTEKNALKISYVGKAIQKKENIIRYDTGEKKITIFMNNNHNRIMVKQTKTLESKKICNKKQVKHIDASNLSTSLNKKEELKSSISDKKEESYEKMLKCALTILKLYYNIDINKNGLYIMTLNDLEEKNLHLFFSIDNITKHIHKPDIYIEHMFEKKIAKKTCNRVENTSPKRIIYLVDVLVKILNFKLALFKILNKNDNTENLENAEIDNCKSDFRSKKRQKNENVSKKRKQNDYSYAKKDLTYKNNITLKNKNECIVFSQIDRKIVVKLLSKIKENHFLLHFLPEYIIFDPNKISDFYFKKNKEKIELSIERKKIHEDWISIMKELLLIDSSFVEKSPNAFKKSFFWIQYKLRSFIFNGLKFYFNENFFKYYNRLNFLYAKNTTGDGSFGRVNDKLSLIMRTMFKYTGSKNVSLFSCCEYHKKITYNEFLKYYSNLNNLKKIDLIKKEELCIFLYLTCQYLLDPQVKNFYEGVIGYNDCAKIICLCIYSNSIRINQKFLKENLKIDMTDEDDKISQILQIDQNIDFLMSFIEKLDNESIKKLKNRKKITS